MKIGVLMGGISSEREVSLKSGEEVFNNLDREKYEVEKILIDKKMDVFEKCKDIDFAFLALHGEFGEDGSVQNLLETMGIPYTGAGMLCSAICMSKDASKRMLKSEGILTPNWYTARRGQEIEYDVIEKIGYPMFAKPNCGGSSVATFKVTNREELVHAIEEGFKWDEEVIIEEFIKGEEITSFIMNGEVYPTIRITANKGDFFDFASKYDDGGASEDIVYYPADVQEMIDDITKKCYRLFNCQVYVRIDMILREGKAYVLELNTLPGMTKNSLIPKSANAKGLSYSELLDKIVEYSVRVRGCSRI